MHNEKQAQTSKTVKSGLYWDQLYRQLNSNNEPALWDVVPSLAIIKDYEKFKSTFDDVLPVIDLGCGSGVQTEYLSTKYDKIIGIDASKRAIQLANKNSKNDNADYEVMDLLDKEAVDRFSKKMGDCNIYVRGVIHQIPLISRIQCINNIKHLMGNSGALYMIETASNIQDYITDLVIKFPHLPSSLANVMKSNFPPLGVSLDDFYQWFGNVHYSTFRSGETVLATNLETSSEKCIDLPATYTLVKK
jgi:SAM-dependent methyltransferase